MWHGETQGFNQTSCTYRGSPNGIHGSQLVRRLFFRQPGHSKYSENLIEYDITELKNDEDVLKVLA